MNSTHKYKRIKCEKCQGYGRLRGVRAKAGSQAAVGRRKLASCDECGGYGFIEVRIKESAE